MELSKVIKERYSVRKYKPDMIWDDELNKILEAGIWETICHVLKSRYS